MKTLLVLMLWLFALDVGAAELSGAARAVDGDTLVIAGAEVDLYGIQAPHLEQTCRTRKGQAQHCGQLAHQALSQLLRGGEVHCEEQRRTPAGRVLVKCRMAWLDLAQDMVASGWALADPVDGADYQRAQTFARARSEGLWRTDFTPPWEWRGAVQK